MQLPPSAGVFSYVTPLFASLSAGRVGLLAAALFSVTPGSPADKGGLKSGDVVRTFNGKPVRDAAGFRLQVAETAPGTKVPVQVVRDREAKDLEVTVNDQPGQSLAKGNHPDKPNGKGHEALAGVAVVDLDGAARRQLSAPENVRGAAISEVPENSAAYEAGLREGYVIVEINHHTVKTAQDAVDLTSHPASNQTLVKAWTPNGVRFFTVEEDNAE